MNIRRIEKWRRKERKRKGKERRGEEKKGKEEEKPIGDGIYNRNGV